jgi:magnesium chelatase family protein
MESGSITISRAGRQAEFPAEFQLVAAMNPCPCGYLGDRNAECHCSAERVQAYRGRISGPLLDRIDMHVMMPRVTLKELNDAPAGEASGRVRERVAAGRRAQHERQQQLNAQLSGSALDEFASLNKRTQTLLEDVAERLGLSTRACHRVRRLARTIADLAGQRDVSIQHLSEAVQYRQLDRLSMDQTSNVAKP